MPIPPYNTGKVLIGSRYEPPRPGLSPDEEVIQCVLLGDPSPLVARRSMDAVISLIVFVCVAVLLAAWSAK